MSKWWSKPAVAGRMQALRLRSNLRRSMEAWFEAADFVAVETPALQLSPGMDPHIHAFATNWRSGMEADQQAEGALWLHTSPEFAMKKLLAAGLPRIHQFARVFRNGEVSPLHHPEFTMLEWYRADSGYLRLIDDCMQLVRLAANIAGTTSLSVGGAEADPFLDWEVITVTDALAMHAGVDLRAGLDQAGQGDVAALAAQAALAGVRTAADDGWDDIFFRIMLEKVEPKLGQGRPCVLIDWPLPLAALARPKPEAPWLAERFELYVAGVELANAFGELTDPVEQRRRFAADQAKQRRLYGTEHPVDEEFLSALSLMPPAAGIALGFDRLVMLCAGVSDIRGVLWAPVQPSRRDPG